MEKARGVLWFIELQSNLKVFQNQLRMRAPRFPLDSGPGWSTDDFEMVAEKLRPG